MGLDEKASVSPTQTRCDWHNIDWASAVTFVRKLRQEIFRATKEGDLKKVRTLQRIMLRSYENRVMAVRQVSQTNRGRNTPGVDRVVLKTPETRGKLVDQLADYELWKPLPAKRVYIPKANGSQRPLGIPVITDRAVQAMVKNALEPFWEAKFEDSSYGFRPGRSCHDALMRIYMLSRASGTRKWVLDADIKGAFDNIGHDRLMEAIGNFPARELIRQWLKAGYLDDGVYHDTPSGTPQGGVISPLLANIAFHGMEEALGVRFNRNLTLHSSSVGLVRYADDFLVFCHTREEAEVAKGKLATWFQARGLHFLEEKTRIVNLEDGFDFLSYNVRLYRVLKSKTGLRLMMRPAKKAVLQHARELKKTFRECRGNTADLLCMEANRLIRGWVQYFRHGVSSKAFQKLTNYLWTLQWRWARWQHPKRSKRWRSKRYWGRVAQTDRDDNWTFHGQKSHMRKHSWTPIKRHVLVQRGASMDDPELEGYWSNRKTNEAKDSLTDFQRAIAKRQKWVCPICCDWILNGEEWHEHRVIPGRDGGKYTRDNVQLVHLFCHHQVEYGGKQRKAKDGS